MGKAAAQTQVKGRGHSGGVTQGGAGEAGRDCVGCVGVTSEAAGFTLAPQLAGSIGDTSQDRPFQEDHGRVQTGQVREAGEGQMQRPDQGGCQGPGQGADPD